MINFYLICSVELDKPYMQADIEHLQDCGIHLGCDFSSVIGIIKRDVYYAYKYAELIIKGRWPEVEPIIMTNPYCAVGYARDLIGCRWLEAEPYIKDHGQHWKWYCQEFGI